MDFELVRFIATPFPSATFASSLIGIMCSPAEAYLVFFYCVVLVDVL